MELTVEKLENLLLEQGYIADGSVAVTLYTALRLQRPLLVEGAAGVGKTEIAKVLSKALRRPLVRLQCHEGLDESKALYEWNYQKQLLGIQAGMTAGSGSTEGLFTEEFLLERPLLRAIRSPEPVILLIDELDKADEEFEAFLLELLSEMQVTIPELGTVTARSVPFVLLTSNNARPLSEALRRRCAYLYLQYPEPEREAAIIRAKIPDADEKLARSVADAVSWLRACSGVLKKPSIAESLDWTLALMALGEERLSRSGAEKTLGFVLKSQEDMEAVLGDENFAGCLR
ncbi:MAG: AAA family ATPase [Candidatus Heteroscillospira sp.]